MRRSQIFPLYFGLFTAYLSWFNRPIISLSIVFLGAALLFFWQMARPGEAFTKIALAVAALFSLFYAGAILRVLFDDFRPFVSARAQFEFLTGCLIAGVNFAMLFFWVKGEMSHPHRRNAAAN